MKALTYTLLFLLFFSCSLSEDQADAYGTFEADEYMVSAKNNGEIIYMDLREGELISAGDTIGIIDTMRASLTIAQLKSQKEATKNSIDQLIKQTEIQEQQKENLLVEKRRLEKLKEDGAATAQEMDIINGKIKLIEKQIASTLSQNKSIYDQLDAMDAQIKLAEYNLQNCFIINPVKGRVLTKFHKAHEITAMGKPIYKIADLENMFLRVYVSENQLSEIKPGQQVTVNIDAPQKTLKNYTGIISWISDQAEFTPKIIQTREERVNLVYAVKVKLKNDGSLKIGMPGDMKIQ